MIIGKKIFEFEEIDSTSSEARRRASQVEEGTVFLSKIQTGGRGKPGSNWFSPEGGLYFSIILKPFRDPKELSEITLVFARAVVSSLLKFGDLKAEIKLPNDVLVKGQKICGILTERISSGLDVPSLIVGIGVNVNVSNFPKDLNATSIKLEIKREVDLKKYFKILLSELDKEYLKFLKSSV